MSTVSTTVVDLSALDSRGDSPAPGANGSDSTHPIRKESTFETAEGTLHVQPFRKKGSKRLKAVLTFVPRASVFDRENATSGGDPFRGFFTLFWISVFLLSIRTYWDHLERTGYPFSLTFATLLSKDAKALLLSDIVLVSATGAVIPFMKLVKNGWIRYYWTGVAIQHVYQAIFVGSAVAWTFKRQWPWVQSGFFTLHSLTMLMKIHSYCAVNGYLSSLQIQYDKTLKKLEKLCSEPSIGGWDKAVNLAKAKREEGIRARDNAQHIIDLNSGFFSSPADGPTPARTPSIEAVSSSRDHTDTDNPASVLRQRLHALQTGPEVTQTPAAQNGPQSAAEDEFAENRHPLCHHPDPRVADLANMLTDWDSELTAPGGSGNKGPVRWPDNVTLWNFMDYQLIPTLVYEMQYPRTATLRPLYLLEKTVATFGTFSLLYTYTEHYIIPLTPTAEQPLLRTIINLILPFMLCYLLLFYIIFECICNGFAELSFFADRQFYEDWWNATSWDEYARKWNKPVHVFLLRHVYASTISSLKFSKTSAAFATFLLSALAHELVMAVVTQKIRLYLFLLQMIQIPLIALGRHPIIRRNKTMGNIVFWFGLLTGFPLLCVAYCAH